MGNTVRVTTASLVTPTSLPARSTRQSIMGRRPASSVSAQKTDIRLRKGAWTVEEDIKLMAYVTKYGCWNWRQLPKFAGLARCGKSCRLRWLNYLNPKIKRGNYSKEEEDTIIRLHESVGNKWSLIAAQLPGRTDNEIKNHWHGKLKKTLKRTPSFRNRTAATCSNLAEEAPTCNKIEANKVLMDELKANNTLTDDSNPGSLQEHKKESDHCIESSSREDIHSDTNKDLWRNPFVVDCTNVYYNNYIDPNEDYFDYAESFAAAIDYGYVGLFSFPSISDTPPAEEDDFMLMLQLWYS